MKNSYNIGLDIGTTSVGWAVINPQTFKIMRKGNKYLWGVRLFEEAVTAEARRLSRGTRRRYDRRRQRIALLQEEFKEEINKVDPKFYQKLKESFYNINDTENKKIQLTKQEKEQIKAYNKKYPTIYHLRQRLIEDDSKCDIRLIYLAIHHIIKYRGNFLYERELNLNNDNIIDKIENIFALINEISEIEINREELSNIEYNKIEEALLNPSKNDKKIDLTNELKKVLPLKITKELVKLLVGDKFSINTLFNKDNDEDIKISLKGSDYDDNYINICKIIPIEIEILEELKEIYDINFLKILMPNSNATTLSSLMVERYDKHKKDLKDLKELLKQDRIVYNSVFKIPEVLVKEYTLFKDNKISSKDFKEKLKKSEGEYCLYEKYTHNKITYEDFIKELKKYIDIIKEELTSKTQTIKEEIIKQMDTETFLSRITDVDNGKFPYQFNRDELIKIINNQSKYYPFLANSLEDGTKKIIRLLEFKIPYYVGPLNTTTKDKHNQNRNAWLIKKQDNIKITPYNFKEVIDLESSAEEFIRRMLGHCTYLLKEPAMPNNSILYSKFKVLNELKQIKVGTLGKEERLTHKNQNKVFEELFLKNNGTITDKKFKEYLKNQKEFSMFESDLSVIGYSADNKFANNMTSYIDFFGEDGFFNNTTYGLKEAEEIINLITIFEDKEVLQKRLEKEYNELNNATIKKICSKKYKGWSSLSEKLLTGIFYKDKKTNVNKSIIDLMLETSENFMQIINNEEYNFNSKIAEYNEINTSKKISYEIINDLATSPANKRGIYQAIKVVEEIIDYMGYEPNSITLEMARGDEKKVRTEDRKKQLEKLYEKSKREIDEYNKLNKELYAKEKIDSEKLFLYFIQEGKSLYSGTPLDINRLDEYEVDHIIPRTLIKDNSIDNKALVLREENQIKAASFVLPEQYRSIRMKGWWQHLKKIGLISSKKYNNLSRYKYDEKSINGFINRQLVETRQICKHVANIINNFHKSTKVNYIPASLSHNYREKFKLYKFRDINDYHHAHDAYLAAVLGEYKTKYLKKSIDYLELKEFTKRLYEEKKYKELNDGYVINSLDPDLQELSGVDFIDKTTGELLFDVKEFNKTVNNTLYRNDILISKKVEFKTGEFYNQTKLKKGNKGLRLKANLPTEMYGSYSSLNPAYAIVVKYTKKGKEEQRMIGIPIVIAENSKTNIEVMNNYIKDLLELNSTDKVEIIKNKIPFYSLLNWDNQICYLVGATSKVEVCNAIEFHIDKERMQKWQKTLLRLYHNKAKVIEDVEYSKDLNEIINYIINKIELKYQLYSNLVPDINNMFSTEVLENADINAKEKIIIEMLNLLKANSLTANLKFLNKSYSMAFGRKEKRIISNAKIINKSVTGLWENIDEF